MSLVSMASVAVARDFAPAGQPLNSLPMGAPLSGLPDPQPDMTPTRPMTTLPRTHELVQNRTAAPPVETAAGFAQLLAAQIPGEALVAYTTLLALFYSAGASYNTGRWVLYGFSVMACGATILATYCAKRNYTLHVPSRERPEFGEMAGASALRALRPPYLPITAAMSSMAVYGLTVPGSPLQFSVSGPAFTVLSGSLSVGGAMMMTILTPFLGTGNDAVPVANSDS